MIDLIHTANIEDNKRITDDQKSKANFKINLRKSQKNFEICLQDILGKLFEKNLVDQSIELLFTK